MKKKINLLKVSAQVVQVIVLSKRAQKVVMSLHIAIPQMELRIKVSTHIINQDLVSY